MIDDIPSEPCIGDAIVKTEIVTRDQMDEEINKENLLYNPEVNESFRRKWNRELAKYFDDSVGRSDKVHEYYIKVNKDLLEDTTSITRYQVPCGCRPCKNKFSNGYSKQ